MFLDENSFNLGWRHAEEGKVSSWNNLSGFSWDFLSIWQKAWFVTRGIEGQVETIRKWTAKQETKIEREKLFPRFFERVDHKLCSLMLSKPFFQAESEKIKWQILFGKGWQLIWNESWELNLSHFRSKFSSFFDCHLSHNLLFVASIAMLNINYWSPWFDCRQFTYFIQNLLKPYTCRKHSNGKWHKLRLTIFF